MPVIAYLKFWREALIAVLVVGLLWYRGSAVSAEADLAICERDAAVLQSNIKTLNAVLAENERALRIIREINAENARAARLQREAAAEAEKRIAVLRSQLSNLQTFINETEEFRDDDTCRTLSDPLPDDFVDWLRESPRGRSDASGNRGSDQRPLRPGTFRVDNASPGPGDPARASEHGDAGRLVQGDPGPAWDLQRAVAGDQPAWGPTVNGLAHTGIDQPRFDWGSEGFRAVVPDTGPLLHPGGPGPIPDIYAE